MMCEGEPKSLRPPLYPRGSIKKGEVKKKNQKFSTGKKVVLLGSTEVARRRLGTGTAAWMSRNRLPESPTVFSGKTHDKYGWKLCDYS